MSGERFESPRHEAADRLVGHAICALIVSGPMAVVALLLALTGQLTA